MSILQRIKQRFRWWIKQRLGLYDIEDLQVGANCGLCGDWMQDAIVPSYWAWDICKDCLGEAPSWARHES